MKNTMKSLLGVVIVCLLILAVKMPSVEAYSTLRMGSRGSDVRVLQQMLNDVDNAKLSVDGAFGSATRNAVRKFQSKNGLSADGICGPLTWNKLVAVKKKTVSQKGAISTQKTASSQGNNNNVNRNNNNSAGQKTIVRNKVTFIVTKGYNASYVTKQTTSVNCTKTAGDIAISMWNGKLYQKTGWSGGCTWREAGSGNRLFKLGLDKSTRQAKLNKAGYLAANGAPCVLRLGTDSGHSVTVIGVKTTANLNAIKYDDLLIGDPADGKIKTLGEMERTGRCWHGGVRDYVNGKSTTQWGLYVPNGVPSNLVQGFWDR